MASKQRLGPASAIHDSRLRWGRERERESMSSKKDNTQTKKRLLHHPASRHSHPGTSCFYTTQHNTTDSITTQTKTSPSQYIYINYNGFF